jgi:hypothetical protein
MVAVVRNTQNAVWFLIYRDSHATDVMTKTTAGKQSAQSQSAETAKASDSTGLASASTSAESAARHTANIARGESTECLIVNSGAIFKGTQEFVVTRTDTVLEKACTLAPLTPLTQDRISCLEKLLHPSRLFGRTVVDLAPQPGYFLFLALQNDAKSVTAIEQNTAFLEMVETACDSIGFDNLQTECASPRNVKQSHDIVLALNADSYLQEFGASIESRDYGAALAALSKMTNYMLIVEAPQSSDTGASAGGSKSTDFETQLRQHFRRVELAGQADGRVFYLAFNTEHDVDLRCPLPKFESARQLELLSCRQLTESAGLQFWSRVYAGPDAIYKQATRELIEREKLMLDQLKSEYFPRVKSCEDVGSSSVLVLEKIAGRTLPSVKAELTSSKSNFLKFVRDCLNILSLLQKAGIKHRDIQPNNFIVRNCRPVLIDFGWAVTDQMPMLLPAGLLTLAPDGQACDAYAVGLMLCDLSKEKFPELSSLFELMTEADPSVRVTNANELIFLLNIIMTDSEEAGAENIDSAALIQKLMGSLKINRARLTSARDAYEQLEHRSMIEKDHRLAILEMEYERVVAEVNKVISELKRVIGEKDELLELLDERQKLIEGITQSQAWRLANQLQKSKKSLGNMFGKPE